MNKSLSIIVPLYNEEKTLDKIIERVIDVNIGDVKKEIIIVNDGSKDNSKQVALKLVKKYKIIKFYDHPKNRGKGAAIRTGFKYATGDFIVIQDADMEYNPKDFTNLIKPIIENKVDVVYGSRMLGNKGSFKIATHYYGNKFLSFLTYLLYGHKITDMETCYKMMTKQVLHSLDLHAEKFDIEPEITSQIMKKKYRFKEIPIEYNARTFGEGKKITWKDGIKAIYTLFKYRFSS